MLEMKKKKVTEMKYALNGLISILEAAEKRIGEIKDRSIEITHTHTKKNHEEKKCLRERTEEKI